MYKLTAPNNIIFKIISLISITFLLSCTNNSTQTIDYNNKNLINAMSAEPSNLIAMIAGDAASSAISSKIFNSLIKYDDVLNYAPDIAESWKISKDQKTITFKLKKGLVWSDNKPITSKDVMFTWKLITNPKTRTPYASDYLLVKKASTPDDFTFKVTYEDNYAPALDTWASLKYPTSTYTQR